MEAPLDSTEASKPPNVKKKKENLTYPISITDPYKYAKNYYPLT